MLWWKPFKAEDVETITALIAAGRSRRPSIAASR